MGFDQSPFDNLVCGLESLTHRLIQQCVLVHRSSSSSIQRADCDKGYQAAFTVPRLGNIVNNESHSLVSNVMRFKLNKC